MEKDTVSSIQLELPLTTSSITTRSLRKNLRRIKLNVAGMLVVPNEYVGLWIRIQHRFGPRMMEWFMSAQMLSWAFVLLYVDDLFQRDAYKQFASIFPSEALLGWVMGILAVARFIGLIINGARPTVTPAIRQWSAAVGFLIWCGITYCFAMSGFIGVWITTYPLAALAELENFDRAAHDHGEVYNGRLDQ